jgi:hypothetical protein
MSFLRGYFHNLGRRLLGPSLHHHHRWLRGWQILNLHVEREALASNLADDRRAPWFFWRFRKRQHVVNGSCEWIGNHLPDIFERVTKE